MMDLIWHKHKYMCNQENLLHVNMIYNPLVNPDLTCAYGVAEVSSARKALPDVYR